MKEVGIFYHPSFSRKSYLTIGNRLRDFPEALQPLLEKANVRMFQAPRASAEQVLAVHAPEILGAVAQDSFCATAYESVGSVLAGMAALARGELQRAFCFIGAGGHHAGYRQFWGACCFNDVVIALAHSRQSSGWRRFAIVDTDAHHGDGTRQLIQDDPEVLHICFCDVDYHSPDGSKVDVDVQPLLTEMDPNRGYLRLVREQARRNAPLQPHLHIWNYGFDTHLEDYGSLGLTEDAYFDICDQMIQAAEAAQVPLQVVLGGGSLSHLATRTIPEIIRRLAES